MDETADIRPRRRGPKLPELALSDEERATLERWARRRSSSQALAERCRIVLACAEGASNTEVAARLGVARPTVTKWRTRFLARRLEGWPTSPALGHPEPHRRAGRTGAGHDPGDHAHRCDPLVDPIVGPSAGNEPDRGQPDLAGLGPQAPPDRGVQALHRPGVHRQGPRHRRALPESARGHAGVVCGRNDPGPGAGPDPRRSCRCCPGPRSGTRTTTAGTAPPTWTRPWTWRRATSSPS